MKKKKYDWPKRCLSLICVLVLISMIILQSVPVTYASENDEILQSLEQSTTASEPEENSQMISTTETLPDEGIQTGTQLVNDIFQEGNTESSSGLQTDGNYEEPSNNISGAETSDNTSGNGEQGTDSMEVDVARDSGACIVAPADGVVKYADADRVVVAYEGDLFAKSGGVKAYDLLTSDFIYFGRVRIVRL